MQEELNVQLPPHAVLIQCMLRCAPSPSPSPSSHPSSPSPSSQAPDDTPSQQGAGDVGGAAESKGAQLLKAAAQELMAGGSESLSVRQVLGASHAEMAAALAKAEKAQPSGSSAAFTQAIRVSRGRGKTVSTSAIPQLGLSSVRRFERAVVRCRGREGVVMV